MKKYLPLLAVAALAAAAPAAEAAVLFKDTFEARTIGGLNGQNGYTALTAATVENGGLDYASGAVNVPGYDKNVTFTGLATSTNNWVFSNTFAAQSGDVYFSIALSWTNQTDNDLLYFALSDAVDTVAALSNSAGFRINPNGTVSDSGKVNGSIRGNSAADTTTTSTTTIAGANTAAPVFIVGKISKVASANYNTLNLWVNPSTLTEGTPSVTVTRDMGISGGLDTFFFFSGSGNENNEVVKVDNITIGTTYKDVIPEPASLGVLALGAVGLLARRKR